MPKKDEKKKPRARVDKNGASVDVNKSGTVSVSVGGGGKPRTRQNPKGEKHVGVDVRVKFGGSKKPKK